MTKTQSPTNKKDAKQKLASALRQNLLRRKIKKLSSTKDGQKSKVTSEKND